MWQSYINIIHKIYIFLIWFYELTERYVIFLNNVTITLSDEETAKAKVIDLDQFYNFYVHDFQIKLFTTSKYCFNILKK